MERQGVANGLYVEVMKFLDEKSMTKSDFTRLSGVPRPTVDRLAYGRDKPRRHTVDAIADAIKMPRDQARVLAGYEPPVAKHSATRQAILEDPIFNPSQRRTMLQLYDLVVSMADEEDDGQQAPPRLPSSGTRRTSGVRGRRNEGGGERRRAG